MLENALDAQSSVIEIKLKEMGTEYIEVCDNGSGISQSNYSSIALKHHTSKLLEFTDLQKVTSFGFRGEALNALCELSGKFSVITKQSDEIVGHQLLFSRNGQYV